MRVIKPGTRELDAGTRYHFTVVLLKRCRCCGLPLGEGELLGVDPDKRAQGHGVGNATAIINNRQLPVSCAYCDGLVVGLAIRPGALFAELAQLNPCVEVI